MTELMSTRITVKKIAEICGISQPVVSAVLNRGKSASNIRFSQETADRVMAVAQENGYRPNRVAQNFHSQKHQSIGVLIHEAGNIAPDAFRNLLRVSSSEKQLICFESIQPDQKELPLFLRKDCVDGVLLFEQLDPQIHEAIQKIKLPAVSINARPTSQMHHVVFDEVDAIKQAVALFDRGGCDRYILTRTFANPQHYSTHERVSTLRWLAHERGLPDPHIVDMDLVLTGTPEQKMAVLDELLELLRKPGKVGLIDTGKFTTLSLIQTIHQSGRNVPTDLMHLYLGNDPTNDYSWPSITRLTVDMPRVIKESVHDLQRLINGQKPVGPPMISYQLFEGQSTKL
ncbi:MAG: hypothetical protein CMJ19_17090 [Phycisphaeraceae bacterium]|nr:hypothetical protein [Phycisphaeraceae bacterium]